MLYIEDFFNFEMKQRRSIAYAHIDITYGFEKETLDYLQKVDEFSPIKFGYVEMIK